MTIQLELSSLKRDWIDRNISRVLDAARGLPSFEAYDLRDAYTNPPACSNWVGIMFARLRKSRLIQEVGFAPSKNKASNGARVILWRLV